MKAAARFGIGAGVECEDGACGRLDRVVVDPARHRVTHLVVDPGGKGTPRLVPVGLVDADEDGTLRLRGDLDSFRRLEAAEEAEFLPGAEGDPGASGYEPEHVVFWPYFVPNLTGSALGGPGGVGAVDADKPVVHERVPAGEVQIRRGERVEAADGETGRVDGLLVDERGEQVTHVLLTEGHLWGRHTVAIPIAQVTRVGTTVRVGLTKDQLKELPPVDAVFPGRTARQSGDQDPGAASA
jgi:hypothetical protein